MRGFTGGPALNGCKRGDAHFDGTPGVTMPQDIGKHADGVGDPIAGDRDGLVIRAGTREIVRPGDPVEPHSPKEVHRSCRGAVGVHDSR